MTDEIRVLHLITRFLNGGAEKTTEHTLDALNEANDDYDLRLGFGAKYDDEHVEKVRSRGIETTCFSSIRHYNPFTAIIAVVTVAIYLRRERIDILHTHSTEAGIIGRIAGWLSRTPVVIHEVHGDSITEDRNKVLNVVIKALERLTAYLSTKIIVKSELIRDTYLSRGIGTQDQYELVYHGVELDKFCGVEPGDIDVIDSEFIALFVGRLEEGKGLFDLLDTFERLNSEVSVQTQLLVAGDGRLRETLDHEISERRLDNIELLGYRDDIPQLMAASDIFVLPSYREGTPRVITEALASGLPVVSTDIAGIPEQVNNAGTGILISPGETDALYDAITTMIHNPFYKKQSINPKNGIKMFDRDNSKERFQEIYNECVSEYIRQ